MPFAHGMVTSTWRLNLGMRPPLVVPVPYQYQYQYQSLGHPWREKGWKAEGQITAHAEGGRRLRNQISQDPIVEAAAALLGSLVPLWTSLVPLRATSHDTRQRVGLGIQGGWRLTSSWVACSCGAFGVCVALANKGIESDYTCARAQPRSGV
jgi:hypothetical protein